MRKYNVRLFGRGATGAILMLLAACASAPRQNADPLLPANEAEPVDAVRSVDTTESIATLIVTPDEAASSAGPLSLRTDAPLRYTVKPGDTLWSVAGYFLRDPWQWPQLWYVNGEVRNPHLIYPGEQLSLVRVDGRTRLAGPEVVEHRAPQIRAQAIENALPVIPWAAIRNFLNGPRLLSRDEIKHAPYVVEYTGEHIDGSANHGVYITHLPEAPAARWAVARIGEEYRDPDTNERLGFEALPVGEVELQKLGDPAEFLITRSSREVLIGDRLLPLEDESLAAGLAPHAPLKKIEGRIISVFDGVTEIPQYHIVALNRGSRDGLDPGVVLSIWQAGRAVPDPYTGKMLELPEQQAGELMVFKLTPKLAYALVLSATRPAHLYDRVRTPVATPR